MNKAQANNRKAGDLSTEHLDEQFRGELSLPDVFAIFWRARWLVILSMIICLVLSVGYALFAQEWYRSEILLAPVEEQATARVGNQFSGLAAIAGVRVGDAVNAENIAVLESREFIRDFIEHSNLLPVLFADRWNSEKGQWRGEDADSWPDLRDGVKVFRRNIMAVEQEQDTGLIKLVIRWKEPQMAATWATELVARVNQRLRDGALRDAETNITYLQSQLSITGVVPLQQAIGRLLEAELQKLMLAQGDREFAFKVVDRAFVPKEPVWPKRVEIVVVGGFIGLLLGAFIAIGLERIRSSHSVGD